MSENVVKKPWPVFLMALWAFLGVGSYFSVAARGLAGGSSDITQYLMIIVLCITIYLVVMLAKFKKIPLIIFAVAAIVVALLQVLSITKILFSDDPSNPIVYLHLYYLVPSVVLAKFALSSKYLKQAELYAVYLQKEVSRKQMLKAMKR